MRTFGTVGYGNGQWIIETLEPHAAIKLKALFTTIRRTQVAPFTFDDKPEICQDLEWFFQRYPMAMSADHAEYLQKQKHAHLDRRAQMESFLKPEYQPTLFKIKGTLRDYQAQAVDLYLANKMLLIGDAVGLGKTLDAIGSFTDPRTLPAAVVVQTHLPRQWAEKIREFTDLRIHIIQRKTPYPLPPADIYIFKYSNIAGWVDIFGTRMFKSVVYDEAQEIRIAGSQKYHAAKELSRNADFVMGLSATPIYNFGDEIYSILDAMKPGCLGDREDFLREWGCGTFERKIGNPAALGTFLRENFLFLRRTRADVSRELPPVNKIVHTVETDNEALDAIEALARTLAIKATTGEFTERGQAARELDMRVRQATGISKAKSVADYVKILLESGESVLLAGWHRDVYDIWLEELKDYKPVMYTGTESPAQKEASKQAFIKGDSNLMIISLRSGVGLDGLQKRGSIVVIGELDWSPQVHEQLIGRLDRDGQENQVTAIYLVANEGSDPPMVSLLGIKASQSRDIIDPLKPIEEQHSDESRIKLLARQYLEKREKKDAGRSDPVSEGPQAGSNPDPMSGIT